MPTKIGNLEFYEVGEVAKKLGTTPRTLRVYLREGYLRGQKIAGRWLITAEALANFLNARSGLIAGTRAKEKPKKRRK